MEKEPEGAETRRASGTMCMSCYVMGLVPNWVKISSAGGTSKCQRGGKYCVRET